MGNLTSPAVIKLKGGLFLLLGLLASALILLQHPTLQIGVLLLIAVWAFCRSYYFAFYVIERYVDPAFRFTGLLSFARYLLRREPETKS